MYEGINKTFRQPVVGLIIQPLKSSTMRNNHQRLLSKQSSFVICVLCQQILSCRVLLFLQLIASYRSLPPVVCIVHCTLYTVHCTLYSVQYSIQCMVYTIQCKLYSLTDQRSSVRTTTASVRPTLLAPEWLAILELIGLPNRTIGQYISVNI